MSRFHVHVVGKSRRNWNTFTRDREHLADTVHCFDWRDEPTGSKPKHREDWQDPYSGRAMTVGELGCAASHVFAWRAAATRPQPTLIVEEDARPVLELTDEIVSQVRGTRVVYVAQRNYGRGGLPVGRLLYRETDHPLWTLGYFVTPWAARKLVEGVGDKPLIPADDLLPALLGLHRNSVLNAEWGVGGIECLSTMQRFVESTTGSEVSTTERGPYLPSDSPIAALTFAAPGDDPGAQRLFRSARRFGFDLTDISAGKPWKGGDLESGQGGMQKLQALRLELTDLQEFGDDDIVLFVDGFDVIFQGHANDLLTFYRDRADGRILIAGEATCWPDKSLDKPIREIVGDGPTPFPNSGVFMGTAGLLRETLELTIGVSPTEDDQLFMHRRLLDHPDRFVVDSGQSAFCCLNHNPEPLSVDDGRGQLVVFGNRWPYVVHANGPTKARLDGDLKAIGGRVRTHYGDLESDRP